MTKIERRKMFPPAGDEENNEPLSNLEEIALGLLHGVNFDEDAPLRKKSSNPEVLARLSRIEDDVIKRARVKGLI